MSAGSPPSEGRSDGAVQLFCMAARRNGYMTDTQCAILTGMSAGHLDLDGFLSLVSLWNVGARFRPQMTALAQDIQALSPAEIDARLKALQEAPPRMIEAVPLEMEWFCYLAVRDRLLTEEQCIELDAELGWERDFFGFAQAVVLVLPSEEFPRIQELVEGAMKYANTGCPPPHRLFTATVRT